jgi:hypothetical protein
MLCILSGLSSQSLEKKLKKKKKKKRPLKIQSNNISVINEDEKNSITSS